MRKDYNLFNSQLGILGTEKETFTKYLLKEKTISDIAEDQGITYEYMTAICMISGKMKSWSILQWIL